MIYRISTLRQRQPSLLKIRDVIDLSGRSTSHHDLRVTRILRRAVTGL